MALCDHLVVPISTIFDVGKETVAHVPAGTAIAMSVSTNALPRAGIVVSWALQVVKKVSDVLAVLLTTFPKSAGAHEYHTCIYHIRQRMRSLLWGSWLSRTTSSRVRVGAAQLWL